MHKVYLFTMKKKNLYPLFFVPFLSFLACTTDVGYAPNEKHLSVSPSYKVKYKSDLPACKGDFEGVAVRVTEYSDQHSDYVCNDGFWILVGYVYDVNATNQLPDIREASTEMKKMRQDFSSVRKSTITDSRDGRMYKVIEFEGVTWMAENLDFETENSKENTACIERGLYCGRLYNWRDAVNGGDDYSDLCPEGFRLPYEADVTFLSEFVGGYAYILKSTDYWDDEYSRQGTDEIGFNALPAGFKDDYRNAVQNFGFSVIYWSGTASSSYQSAYAMSLSYSNEYIGWSIRDQYDYFSIRCLKD